MELRAVAIGHRVALPSPIPSRPHMNFRDYATNETSLLIDRLLAERSKESSSELQRFRHALDEAARALEATVGTCARVEHVKDVLDVVERLTAAAAAQTQALVQSVKADAEAALKAVYAELDEQVNEATRLAATLETMREEAKALRAEIQRHEDRTGASRAELVKAHDACRMAET